MSKNITFDLNPDNYDFARAQDAFARQQQQTARGSAVAGLMFIVMFAMSVATLILVAAR